MEPFGVVHRRRQPRRDETASGNAAAHLLTRQSRVSGANSLHLPIHAVLACIVQLAAASEIEGCESGFQKLQLCSRSLIANSAQFDRFVNRAQCAGLSALFFEIVPSMILSGAASPMEDSTCLHCKPCCRIQQAIALEQCTAPPTCSKRLFLRGRVRS